MALTLFLVAGCVSNPDYTRIAAPIDTGSGSARFNEDLSLLASQAGAMAGDYRIGPEDLLEITLYDIANKDGEPSIVSARVSDSGFITLPHIGKCEAKDLTPIELERRLQELYTQFIHEPQITIFVREYRSYRVSVVGHVESPGVLELRGRKTLLEALALAGGLSDDAGRSVRLSRQTPEEMQSVIIDLEQLASQGDIQLNIPLLPGDVVNVPRAGVFYVEGTVLKPGSYPILADTTVSQAIAAAGGVDINLAQQSGTTLYRKTDNGQRMAIPVDIASIRMGTTQDFLVMPDDVIVVPVSGAKYAMDKVAGLFRVGLNSRI